jgi:transposase InsO family protein
MTKGVATALWRRTGGAVGKGGGAAALAAGRAERAARAEAARTLVAERRRLRAAEAEGAKQGWSSDFVSPARPAGRTIRWLTLIDEYTRAGLAIRVASRLGSQDVIATRAEVRGWRGIPEPRRSDHGPAFLAQEWLGGLGTGTLDSEPGSPWENGDGARFKDKRRDECLKGEISYSRKAAQIGIEPWRVEYNTRRPPSALGYRPPVPAAGSPLVGPSPVSQPRAVMRKLRVRTYESWLPPRGSVHEVSPGPSEEGDLLRQRRG